ncbi:MAG: DUF58 domain-containing protein [bacterium]|nr:DUF58 domain-containing protein [bacterium]
MSAPSQSAPESSVRPTGAALTVIAVGVAGLVGELVDLEPFGIVFGVCAAALLLAWFLAVQQLKRVEIEPPAGGMSFATVPRSFELTARCTGTSLAARDVLIAIDDGRKGEPPLTGHVARIPPGVDVRTSVTPRFRDRGRRKHVTVEVRSSFPFGLFEATRRLRLDVDHVVLPRLGRLGPLERRLANISGRVDDAQRGALGDGEFYGLREWREGQSMRRVHWKLSARRGRLLLRELVSEDRPAIRLVLSTWVLVGMQNARVPSFERAVSLAATLVEHFLRRGHRLELALAGPEPSTFTAVRGRTALIAFLCELAEVRHAIGEPTDAFRSAPPGGRFVNLFVLAGGRVRRDDAKLPPPGAWVLDVDDESGIEVFEGMRDPSATRRTSHELLGKVTT